MTAPTKTILCADDSLTALTMHQMILRSHGYRVVTAQDGIEAVAMAGSESPDLILMDVVMPRMTGPEAVLALRARDDTRHIPIIMVTTRGEEDAVAAAVENGCDDYLTKPIDGPALLAKVRNHLRE